MSNNNDRIMHALNRLERRFDENGAQVSEFLAADAAGEQPDPAQFSKLLEIRSVTRRVMEAQFKMHEKPLKTVLGEVK